MLSIESLIINYNYHKESCRLLVLAAIAFGEILTGYYNITQNMTTFCSSLVARRTRRLYINNSVITNNRIERRPYMYTY